MDIHNAREVAEYRERFASGDPMKDWYGEYELQEALLNALNMIDTLKAQLTESHPPECG